MKRSLSLDSVGVRPGKYDFKAVTRTRRPGPAAVRFKYSSIEVARWRRGTSVVSGRFGFALHRQAYKMLMRRPRWNFAGNEGERNGQYVSDFSLLSWAAANSWAEVRGLQ